MDSMLRYLIAYIDYQKGESCHCLLVENGNGKPYRKLVDPTVNK